MFVTRCLLVVPLVTLAACASTTDAPRGSAPQVAAAPAPAAVRAAPAVRTRQQNLDDRERLATAVERLARCRAETPADAALERYYREIKIESADSANRDALLRSDSRLTDEQQRLVYRVLILRKPCRAAYLRDLAALPRFADAVSDGIRQSDSAYLRLVEGKLTIGEFNTELERVDAGTQAEWQRLVAALESEVTVDDAADR